MTPEWIAKLAKKHPWAGKLHKRNGLITPKGSPNSPPVRK